ncbi:MAG: NAD(P)/FAD-dependent oxidoreductase [Actinobacteria bacterium]|jgi:NADH dehydrogenase|nr:NAD(P)/FAD-dependent oxidoreductase [Actinomycetota bacterium]
MTVEPSVTTPSDTQTKHRIVIIGSGFGGLFAARALKRRKDVDVTLIARTTHHLFQPLLYQVATGVLSEGEIAPATREVLSHQKNARVLLGEVTHIGLDTRTVAHEVMGRQTVTPYDSLIVAAGAGQSYFGNDQFSDHAPGMKTIDDALELRGRIFGAFELAELAPTEEERRRLLTFVVVGAGPTGVEMAGQIAELAQRTLRNDFRVINPSEARVVLLDAGPGVLPSFGENLGGKARAKLEEMGIEVLTSTKVVDVDSNGLVIESQDGTRSRIESKAKVWAAGVSASPLGQQLSAQSESGLDRAGRVEVAPDLTLKGRPEVFVIGDMMALRGLPGVAQVAIQGARYAVKVITARLDGKPSPEPFSYFDKGSMATISRFSAVVSMGKIQFGGFIAWLAWLGLHLVYITGFKSRVTTLLHWFVTFIGRGRAQRVTTAQQVLGRRALQMLAEQARPQLPPVADDPTTWRPSA